LIQKDGGNISFFVGIYVLLRMNNTYSLIYITIYKVFDAGLSIVAHFGMTGGVRVST
jgi:hypothetical protein